MQSLPQCARDAHQCVTEGAPLHWASPCLQYAVQRDGSEAENIDAQTLQQAVEQAFALWAGAQCPDGGTPRFQAQFQGFVGCARREAVCGGAEANVNVIMFQDDAWPGKSSEIALTVPTGGTRSGLVVDADMELNSRNFDFTLADDEPGALQLSTVLAHEVGHFLGLGHSDAPAALMSTTYENIEHGAELLTSDDIAAICSVYPPGAALSCPPPPPPAYDECSLEPGTQPPCQLASMTHDQRGGCSIAPPSAGQRRGSVAALAFTFLLAWRRRSRQRVAGKRRAEAQR